MVSSIERQMRTPHEHRMASLCRWALDHGFTKADIQAGKVILHQRLYHEGARVGSDGREETVEWVQP